MSRRKNISASPEITAEACAWIAQLETGNLSESDLFAIREWIRRSPQHEQELKSIANLSSDLTVLTALGEPLANVVEKRTSNRKMKLNPVLAGLFSLCFAFVFAWYVHVDKASIESPLIFATEIGQYQTIELEDGSSVKLNTASQIEVSYSEKMRRVRLISGEALFDVNSDPKRPFVVYSGETVTRAVGTSFVVRLRNLTTEVSVVEGTIAFSRAINFITSGSKSTGAIGDLAAEKENAEHKPVLLTAGQSIVSNELPNKSSESLAIKVEKIDERTIQRKLSWTEGLFDFSETRLDEVVEEVSRHHSIEIIIVNSKLKELKFGGMFRTEDLESFLGALEGLGIEVIREGDSRILLEQSEVD